MANNINNWGTLALAKFESIAQAERMRQQEKGLGQTLPGAQVNDPKGVQSALNRAKSFNPGPIVDSTHLSPEALKLTQSMSGK